MIGIIDYGAGNLASIMFALKRIGAEVEVCSQSTQLEKYSHVILPGVGSFKHAMSVLENEGWISAIKIHTEKKLPLLGVCLGMQLFFEEGDEHGKSNGLGLLKGKVKLMEPNDNLKIPHLGWNQVDLRREHQIFEGIRQNIDFYFVHSYHCIPEEESDILGTFSYGSNYVACISKDNIIGVQFHPEKSQPAGLRILQNFANWDVLC